MRRGYGPFFLPLLKIILDFSPPAKYNISFGELL